MIIQLQRWAAARNWRIACGSALVLQQTRAELDGRRSAGELDADFFAGNLSFFRYEQSSERASGVRGVIVVAMPRPAHRLLFETEAGPREVLLPPTYLRYQPLFQEVRQEITAAIPELRGHLEVLLAPLKSIASRLGLVEYGRNNLTYIPEWGSYFQLLGYITDQDLGLPEDWTPAAPRLMEECEHCGLCAALCPAGAIPDDRVLLHAESCTTLFSEQAGDLTHDLAPECLFGCLECQQACPVNRGLLNIEPAASFDRRETEAILHPGGAIAPDVRARVAAKIAALGLTEATLVGRNLAHLLGAGRAPYITGHLHAAGKPSTNN